MNSRQQGNIGIGQAIAYFAIRQWPAFSPLSDMQRYDLIVDIEGKLNRVEVKTSTLQKPNGSWEFNLRTFGGNQSWNKVVKSVSAEDADMLFLHCIGADSYFMPTEVVKDKSTITVGNLYSEYKLEYPGLVQPLGVERAGKRARL